MKIDWLSLRTTDWVYDKHVAVFQKRYYVMRRDGLPINVFLSCLPGDAPFILQDLEICASRAIRSYEGCECTWHKQCAAHAKPVDVKQYRGVPDSQQTPEGLRAWLVSL